MLHHEWSNQVDWMFLLLLSGEAPLQWMNATLAMDAMQQHADAVFLFDNQSVLEGILGSALGEWGEFCIECRVMEYVCMMSDGWPSPGSVGGVVSK